LRELADSYDRSIIRHAPRDGQRTLRELPTAFRQAFASDILEKPPRMMLMTTKQILTEAELKQQLIDAIRKHPECAQISNVAFTRPTWANWDVAWVMQGPASAPAIAHEIVRQFQQQYDLA
jgi:hypothetical protein